VLGAFAVAVTTLVTSIFDERIANLLGAPQVNAILPGRLSAMMWTSLTTGIVKRSLPAPAETVQPEMAVPAEPAGRTGSARRNGFVSSDGKGGDGGPGAQPLQSCSAGQ
jgi:hypothetical protein